jgi:hypothetical protein
MLLAASQHSRASLLSDEQSSHRSSRLQAGPMHHSRPGRNRGAASCGRGSASENLRGLMEITVKVDMNEFQQVLKLVASVLSNGRGQESEPAAGLGMQPAKKVPTKE